MDWTTFLLPSATAFGLALLHSLWIGALIYFVVRSAEPLLRSPAARHNLAYAGLLALGAGFILAFHRNFSASPVCENLAATTINLSDFGAIFGTVSREQTWPELAQAALPELAPWLSACYLFGLLPASLLLLRDYRRSVTLQTRGLSEFPLNWANSVSAELLAHPATRRVRCYLSYRAGEVMTIGFWSPVIIFPLALVNSLSPEMARTILLHEIAHLRAWDHWLNYPQQILRTFFFYHPAAHALSRIIDREREHRCDDWVAERCSDRRTYASALVTVARISLYPQNTLVMSASKTPFSSRIQRLFEGETPRRGHFAFSMFFLGLLTLGHLSFTTLGADAGAVKCLEELSKSGLPSSAELNPVVVDADGFEVNISLEELAALAAGAKDPNYGVLIERSPSLAVEPQENTPTPGPTSLNTEQILSVNVCKSKAKTTSPGFSKMEGVVVIKTKE